MGGGYSADAAVVTDDDTDLLEHLGIDADHDGTAATDRSPATRFVLWRDNQVAYTIFARIAGHGQWQRAGMDGLVIGLDGQYLINYLKLTFKSREIPDLLDDVHCIVDGWVTAQNEKRKDP